MVLISIKVTLSHAKNTVKRAMLGGPDVRVYLGLKWEF